MDGWISVDDRLPKDNALMIISYTFQTNGNTYQGCASYLKVGEFYQWYSDDGQLVFERGDVTHWQPLPKPPEH